jgi:hypothetical protein
MSLSERSRSVIYDRLNQIIEDREAVDELMSHFPARDLDEPVTKEFHRAETATLRAEMAASHGELRTEIATTAGQLRTEIATTAGELRSEIAGLRGEVGELRTEMRVGFADVRAEMHRSFQRMTLSLAALMVSMTGATVAALTIAR